MHDAMAGSRASRDRYLSRQPHPAVQQAIATGEWHGAIRWTLGEALRAVNEAGGSPVAAYLDVPMFAGGMGMRDWLNLETTQLELYWGIAESRIMALSYQQTLLQQRRCTRQERKLIDPIAKKTRDVIVTAACSQAGGHHDEDNFKKQLNEAFGRPLENSTLNAQLLHSFHQLTNNSQGAFPSNCKRGRIRRARVRQAREGCASTEAYDTDCDGTRGRASSTLEPWEAAESPKRDAEPTLTELKGMMANESQKLWQELAKEKVERVRLDTKLRTFIEASRGSASQTDNEVRKEDEKLHLQVDAALKWLGSVANCQMKVSDLLGRPGAGVLRPLLEPVLQGQEVDRVSAIACLEALQELASQAGLDAARRGCAAPAPEAAEAGDRDLAERVQREELDEAPTWYQQELASLSAQLRDEQEAHKASRNRVSSLKSELLLLQVALVAAEGRDFLDPPPALACALVEAGVAVEGPGHGGAAGAGAAAAAPSGAVASEIPQASCCIGLAADLASAPPGNNN